MERLKYILDTNVIADVMNGRSSVAERFFTAVEAECHIYLCQPVYYEVMRGLLKVNAMRKQTVFQETIMPMLSWMPLINVDWRQAAQFWAAAC